MYVRREFLKLVTIGMVVAASSPAWLEVFGKKAEAASGDFTNFTVEEGQALNAMISTLISTENDVVEKAIVKAANALDAVAGSDPDTLKIYKDGVRDLNKQARRAGGKDFADLSFEDRKEVLKTVEGSPFLAVLIPDFLSELGKAAKSL